MMLKKILWLREKVLLREIQVQQLEMRGKKLGPHQSN